MSLRVVVVSGGLSAPSSTRLLADRLADAVTAVATETGNSVEIIVVELRDLAHDITNALLTGFAAGELAAAQRQLIQADAIVAVTPTFNASFSGLFKSFFDTIEADALTGIPVIVAATGGTERHALILDHSLRPMFTYLHATVMPTGVYAASSDWASEAAEALTRRINRAAGELLGVLAQRQAPRASDPFANVTPFARLLDPHNPDRKP